MASSRCRDAGPALYHRRVETSSPYGIYADVFEPPRVSKLAIAALVCSLLFCLIIPPILGVVLGLWALVALIDKPNVRGRGIAIAAIVLGLCFTTGIVVFGSRAVREVLEAR